MTCSHGLHPMHGHGLHPRPTQWAAADNRTTITLPNHPPFPDWALQPALGGPAPASESPTPPQERRYAAATTTAAAPLVRAFLHPCVQLSRVRRGALRQGLPQAPHNLSRARLGHPYGTLSSRASSLYTPTRLGSPGCLTALTMAFALATPAHIRH